jgi:tRNA/tmRNA/rRNA uracil-C5-methylase (TrmA/RlmC/RlmD family)
LNWDALAYSTPEADLVIPPGATFASYAAASTMLPGVAEFLGDLAGKRVLEYRCGLGRITGLLAGSDAEVDGFDISPESVATAHRRVEANGLSHRVQLTVDMAEELP